MLSQKMYSVAKKNRDKVAINHNELEITYGSLVNLINDLSINLNSHGIGEKTLVCLFLKNSIEFIAYFFSLAKLGAIIIPVDIRFTSKEIADVVELFSPQYIITDDECNNKHANVINTIIADKIIVEYSKNFNSSCSKFNNSYSEPVSSFYSDEFIIQYTSGSTGKSKGILHTQRSMYNIFTHVEKTWSLNSDDRMLCAYVLSSAHATQNFIVPSLLSGATLFILDIKKVSPRSVAKLIMKHQITIFTSLPYFFKLMIQAKGINSQHFTSIKYIVSGSAPYNEKVGEDFYNLFSKNLCNMYGMAEIGPTHINRQNFQKISKYSIGIPYYGVKCKVVSNTGNEVSHGEIGELYLKSDSHANCYWKNTEESNKVFSSDGWIHTGDLVSVDDEGYYHIHARKSQVINVGGNKVSPDDIERSIAIFHGIKDVAVVGVHLEDLSDDVIVAFVIIDKEKFSTIGDLRKYCNCNLVNYKQVRKFIIVDSFPRSDIGKIKKKELEILYRASHALS